MEEFISGQPLPVTDVIINPNDGAMYLAVGGRGAQSALYRVTYSGDEVAASSQADPQAREQRALRRKLETWSAAVGSTAPWRVLPVTDSAWTVGASGPT